jgi:hypothetical protein
MRATGLVTRPSWHVHTAVDLERCVFGDREGARLWFQQVHCLLEDTHPHTSTTEYVTHCPVVTVVTVVPQVLEVYVNDSHLTGRPKVGKATLPLAHTYTHTNPTVTIVCNPTPGA